MDNKTVPFIEKDVREYLDRNIKQWRKIKNSTRDEKMTLEAFHYIDALQVVREALFGETLGADRE